MNICWFQTVRRGVFQAFRKPYVWGKHVNSAWFSENKAKNVTTRGPGKWSFVSGRSSRGEVLSKMVWIRAVSMGGWGL